MKGPAPKKVVIPAWAAHIPDDARISAKELMGFMGYKQASAVTKAVKAGSLPPPEIGFRARRYWAMKVLRDWVAQH